MSDPVWRVLLAVAAVGAAVLVAAGARVRALRRAAVMPIDLSGIPGRVVFFSDVACRKCDEARSLLEDRGVAFEEIAYEREPDRMRAAGAEAVPLIIGRSADGSEVGRIAGRVRPRSLDRLLASISD